MDVAQVPAADVMRPGDYTASAQSLVELCTGFGKNEIERLAGRFADKTAFKLYLGSKGFIAYSLRAQCALGVLYTDYFPSNGHNGNDANFPLPFLEKLGLSTELLGCAVIDNLIDLMKLGPEQLRKIKRPSTEMPKGAIYSLENRLVWLEAYGQALKISSAVKRWREPGIEISVSIAPEHNLLRYEALVQPSRP